MDDVGNVALKVGLPIITAIDLMIDPLTVTKPRCFGYIQLAIGLVWL